jgi:hypothetical protein
VSAAAEALDAMIASCRKMETLVADSMPALTAAVRAETERTIAAGTSAYGEQWQPTQQGERPLKHAAKAVTVLSVNRTIFITIVGPEARHHLGRVKGKRKRGIIPERGLPSTMANALRAELERAFQNAAAKP